MSLIHRLFGAESDAAVLCPRCERAMEGHDEAACQRRMSRRYFFGLVGAAAVTSVAAPSVGGDFSLFDLETGALISQRGISLADILAMQLELIRPKLIHLYEHSDAIGSLLKREQEHRLAALSESVTDYLLVQPS